MFHGKMKAVTFSYDDGPIFDIRLAEIFDKYSVKGTFNINSGFVGGGDKRLGYEDIKSHILEKGHEVAIHGENHVAPGTGFPPQVIADILNCRKALENALGIIIRGMAYPDSGVRRLNNGNNYENIRSYIKNLGVVYSRTLGGDNDSFTLPEDFYSWMPTAHHKNPELFDMVDKFLNINEASIYSAALYPRIFYLWGHSYEFDSNDGWNLIENFCEKISGKEDTWYATNIEICEYVTAYYSLIRSADGKTVYNPTLIDIWMNVDGRTVLIKSGETIKI